MATTGLYYHIEFKNADRAGVSADYDLNPQQVHIRIYDLSLEDETTTSWNIIELTGSGDPFHTATIDNAEDKFTGIKPIQATIKFLSTELVDLSTFVNGPIPAGGVDPGDPRWRVEAYLNTYAPQNIIFKGFLNLDDCYEPFLPPKNEVVLVANDGLGGLKNKPLIDFDGKNPKGYYRIADILTFALAQTGLSEKLHVVFNIREASLGSYHLFDKIYVHAKTFENKIGESINCFDVIERILGEEAFLTQRHGEWFILRVDELAGDNPMYRTVFDTDGTLLTTYSGSVGYNRSIQKESNIFFSQEATTVHPLRPHKSIQETYDFEYPSETVDNVDFSRGDLNGIDLGNPRWKAYNADDWTMVKTSGSVTASAYIVRKFKDTNLTYEDERYLRVLPASSSASPWDFVRSNPIPVHQRDRLNVSVDFRYETADSSSAATGRYIFTFFIFTGTQYYWFNQSANKWVGPLGFTAQNWGVLHNWDSTDIDETNYQNVSVELPPCAVDGDLYIGLFNGHNFDTTARILNYSNLRVEYIPYINGDYSRYTSFYHKISRPENYVNTRENQVYLSSGFKKLFKGQLFKLDGATYELATDFFAWNDIQDTTPDPIYVHPYGFIQAYDVWNQYRNPLVKFQATCQGLVAGIDEEFLVIDHPRLINRWFLEDSTDNTDFRRFMLLSFDINWYSCEWTGTFIEIYNEQLGKSYLDTLETRYV